MVCVCAMWYMIWNVWNSRHSLSLLWISYRRTLVWMSKLRHSRRETGRAVWHRRVWQPVVARTKASYGGGRPQVRWYLAGWYLVFISWFWFYPPRPVYYHYIFDHVLAWHRHSTSHTRKCGLTISECRAEHLISTHEMTPTSPFQMLS